MAGRRGIPHQRNLRRSKWRGPPPCHVGTRPSARSCPPRCRTRHPQDLPERRRFAACVTQAWFFRPRPWPKRSWDRKAAAFPRLSCMLALTEPAPLPELESSNNLPLRPFVDQQRAENITESSHGSARPVQHEMGPSRTQATPLRDSCREITHEPVSRRCTKRGGAPCRGERHGARRARSNRKELRGWGNHAPAGRVRYLSGSRRHPW